MSGSIGRSVAKAAKKKTDTNSRAWWIGELYTARRKGMGAVLGRSAVVQITEILEKAGVRIEPLHQPDIFHRISGFE